MTTGTPATPAGNWTPQFVVLGTITRDLIPGGYVIGGTTSYAAITAHRLGYRAAIVTAGAPPEATVLEAEGVRVFSAPSPAYTVFENVYQGGLRQQYLRSRAADVTVAGMPEAWTRAPVVHLGPLTQEVDPALATHFPDALIGATPQGWLRKWDAEFRVGWTPWADIDRAVEYIDALVFSEMDVNRDEAVIERYARAARLAVVTRGELGSDVYLKNRVEHMPAYAAQEVEPTGAGDVFAGAFFLKYAETRDPVVAADWANCVASFAVEGPGVSTIPTLDQVMQRQRTGPRALRVANRLR
jgi:sugar/nucleoside kinase (ribokinase family)